jgi:hypothetical protein
MSRIFPLFETGWQEQYDGVDVKIFATQEEAIEAAREALK